MHSGTYDPYNHAFSVTFPLVYRVLALVGFGGLGWAMNLHILSLNGIDSVAVLDLRQKQHEHLSPLPEHSSGFRQLMDNSRMCNTVYRIFITFLAVCFASWLSYRYATGDQASIVDDCRHIPSVTVALLFGILICPYNILFMYERKKFMQAIWRCCLSSMDSPVYFSDVVLADIFTSFAKVFGDAWVAFLMTLPGGTFLHTPKLDNWHRWMLPTIMSAPYFIRFKQCIAEYSAPSNTSQRPLFNALKYFTAFPVLYLSSAQPILIAQLRTEKGAVFADQPWHGEHYLFRLWLLTTMINSMYSFWWDVTNDWGLELFWREPSLRFRAQQSRQPIRLRDQQNRSSLGSPYLSSDTHRVASNDHLEHVKHHHWGLRTPLFYPTWVYPLLIVVNLVLRLVWLVKLSSHLHLRTDGTIATFVFEIIEVLRRWFWVFLRVEWEVIRKARERHSTSQIAILGEGFEYEMASSFSLDSDTQSSDQLSVK